MPYSKEALELMQDEISSLMKAWVDRGVPPSDASVLLAATSHLMVIEYTELTFGQFIQIILGQWERHDGKI